MGSNSFLEDKDACHLEVSIYLPKLPSKMDGKYQKLITCWEILFAKYFFMWLEREYRKVSNDLASDEFCA